MGQAVLISIRPEWTRKIISREKTIEVRKSRPKKLNSPFKCYIYQCLPKYGDWNDRDGHVIGEFVCDDITRFDVPFPAYWDQVDKATLDAACLTYGEAHNYLGHRTGWAWHISDLVIYNKPMALSKFFRWYEDGDDIRPCQNGKRCQHLIYDYSEDCTACAIDFDGTDCPYLKVTRPPQSWCYVEDMT